MSGFREQRNIQSSARRVNLRIGINLGEVGEVNNGKRNTNKQVRSFSKNKS